jgi:hypothetical protein
MNTSIKEVEVYLMGIRDYLRELGRKKSSSYNLKKTYEKSRCTICGQICYNKEDLQLRLKYNHPDIPSAPAYDRS